MKSTAPPACPRAERQRVNSMSLNDILAAQIAFTNLRVIELRLVLPVKHQRVVLNDNTYFRNRTPQVA